MSIQAAVGNRGGIRVPGGQEAFAMTDREKWFFRDHGDAQTLYERLRERICEIEPKTVIDVRKTQISFKNRHLFAAVSFARVRRAALCPKGFITVTFGLPYRLESRRIDVAAEPYPNRWTHHAVIGSEAEIDEELIGWIREAAAFSAARR